MSAREIRELPAARIVAAVADAAARWADADFPPRVRATAAVVERTGYSEPVVEYALDRLFGSLTARTLRAAIAGELGSLDSLDGFVTRDGRPDVFFRGLDEVTIVSSQTTIGVAIPPLAYALCAKSNVVVKDRSDHLVASFAASLAQERAQIAGALRVEAWETHDDLGALQRISASDAVLAFGSNQALRAIRAHVRPDARFIPFGNRTSAGYVGRETLSNESRARAAAGAAMRDAMLYDGEGCLSLHALFVERDGAVSFERFAEFAREALAAVAVEFPAGRSELAPQTISVRDAERFRASQRVERPGAVAVANPPGGLLLIDPPLEQPPPLVPRAAALYGVDAPAQALAFLQRHALPLEGFATDDERADVLELAVASGASQIAPLGTLQSPNLAGEHGGVGRILPFVRAITKIR
jgi:hypothetical protein